MRRKAEAHATKATIDNLNIVCQSARDVIGTLSGGNQQKIIVGRWLSQSCAQLVPDEPIHGVDIKARRDISDKIRDPAKVRATIVMASEMDEVLDVADRVLVLSDHSIVGDHTNEALD